MLNANHTKFTVILSAYRAINSQAENLIATEALAAKLKAHNFTGIDYKRAVGCYQGQVEQAFIIFTSQSSVVDALKRLAWDFEQDCILVSNNRRKVIRLYYPDSAPLEIGERFAINNKLAGNGLLSYTIVRGEYWAVV